MPVCLGDGADRDLTDLRTAAHDDHALPEDAAVRLFLADVDDGRERPQFLDQRCERRKAPDLEEDAVDVLLAAEDHDPGDVAAEASDHAGQLVEDARPALRPDEEAERGTPRCLALGCHRRHSSRSATNSILSSSSGTTQRNSKGSLPSVRYQ